MWNKIHPRACLSQKPKDGDEPNDPLSILSRGLFPKHLKRYLKNASGLKQLSHLACCLRRFQKLGLYTRCFILLALACLFIYLCKFIQLSPTVTPRSKNRQPIWIPHKDCVADDCHLKDPLPLSKLSPNLLLILIHASAGGRERRDAIRKTWVSGLNNQLNSPIQYRFVVGGQQVPGELFSAVLEEADNHNDIIVFPTVTDSAVSLTKRTLVSLKYAYESFGFQYVMKCDDDTFVDVLRVATELEQRTSKQPLYWGYMTGKSKVHYFGRYPEFNYHVCDYYVPHALGGGYVLSRDLVKILAFTSDHLMMYHSEDVAVGAWLAPYSMELRHDARFNTATPSRGCKDPFLALHKVSVPQMLAYHESLTSEGRVCSWRTYNYEYNGYIYDWTAPRTSACCKLNSFVP